MWQFEPSSDHCWKSAGFYMIYTLAKNGFKGGDILNDNHEKSYEPEKSQNDNFLSECLPPHFTVTMRFYLHCYYLLLLLSLLFQHIFRVYINLQ